MLKENAEVVVAVIVALILGLLWWQLWVKPNQEIAYQIMECMGDSTSEHVYEDCRQQVVARIRSDK